MPSSQYASRYQELLAYQKAWALQQAIFQQSAKFPKEEAYALTGQIRRSSRAIGANLAEAWGKRRYEKHFISKLTDANSEQLETQHWINTATACNYWPKDLSTDLFNRCEEVGRLLNGMLDKAHLFCQSDHHLLRETQALYFTTPPED